MDLFFTRRSGPSAPAEHSPWRMMLAFCCILLVLLAGGAQLLHQHGGAEVQDTGCPLCVVAHCSVTVTPVLSTPVMVAAVEDIPLALYAAAPIRAYPFDLYVRPPPVENA